MTSWPSPYIITLVNKENIYTYSWNLCGYSVVHWLRNILQRHPVSVFDPVRFRELEADVSDLVKNGLNESHVIVVNFGRNISVAQSKGCLHFAEIVQM